LLPLAKENMRDNHEWKIQFESFSSDGKKLKIVSIIFSFLPSQITF
jgi:hypothetical protein